MTEVLELIGLADMSDYLNERFRLEDPNTVGYRTPFMWWRRSKDNWGISDPMPEPDALVGRKERPMWQKTSIVVWYGGWQGHDVEPRLVTRDGVKVEEVLI